MLVKVFLEPLEILLVLDFVRLCVAEQGVVDDLEELGPLGVGGQVQRVQLL